MFYFFLLGCYVLVDVQCGCDGLFGFQQVWCFWCDFDVECCQYCVVDDVWKFEWYVVLVKGEDLLELVYFCDCVIGGDVCCQCMVDECVYQCIVYLVLFVCGQLVIEVEVGDFENIGVVRWSIFVQIGIEVIEDVWLCCWQQLS